MKIKRPLLFYLILAILGCNPESNTSPLTIKSHDEKLDSDVILRTTYWGNKILNVGPIRENKKHGYWYEFYTDGTIRWHGLYKYGEIKIPECSNKDLGLKLMHNGVPLTKMKKDETYEIKIKSQNIHPNYFELIVPLEGIGKDFEVKLHSADVVGYDYAFTSHDTGKVEITLKYPCKNKEHNDHSTILVVECQ